MYFRYARQPASLVSPALATLAAKFLQKALSTEAGIKPRRSFQKRKASTQIRMPKVLEVGRALKTFTLNFGPQHPAAHGILRIAMSVAGEVIQQADAQFGLLHRGSEKLAENRNYLQTLPYFDRFDYVANFYQEHAYCLAVEALHSSTKTSSALTLASRTMFDELSRIANHLLTLSAVTMDMGAMAPIFWAFEEREQLMEFFERASGARMHTALYKPFSVDQSALNASFYKDLARFLNRSARALSGAFLGLLNNRALKSRYASVGQLTSQKILNYGISGILARSSGAFIDLRASVSSTYGSYKSLSFKSYIGRRGDNLDRFILRVKETVEAFRIIAQLIKNLSATKAPSSLVAQANSPYKAEESGYFAERKLINRVFLWTLASKKKPAGFSGPTPCFKATTLYEKDPHSGLSPTYTSMEGVIAHFKVSSEGFLVSPGLTYGEVESPKGFVGVFLASNGSSRPFRMKVRTPVGHNLNLIPSLSPGTMFADFVATFCSLDVVLGEIDR